MMLIQDAKCHMVHTRRCGSAEEEHLTGSRQVSGFSRRIATQSKARERAREGVKGQQREEAES